MADTVSAQAKRIEEEVKKFSEQFEQVLGCRRNGAIADPL